MAILTIQKKSQKKKSNRHINSQFTTMQRNYNFIYSKLVESENDLIGHIAYSLYKQQKIQHIEDFKKTIKEKLQQIVS